MYVFPKLHNLGVYGDLYHASDPKSAFNLKIGFEKSSLWLWFWTQVHVWRSEPGKVLFISYHLTFNVKLADEILNGI